MINSVIREIVKKVIEESYKITSTDKDKIDSLVRAEYDKYLERVKKNNHFYETILGFVNHLKNAGEDEMVELFKKEHKLLLDNGKETPILYNKFYEKNYKQLDIS